MEREYFTVEDHTPDGIKSRVAVISVRNAAEDNAELIAQAPELREFAEIVARMKTEQEFIDEGGELEDDDSINALDELIASARKITGVKP